MHPLVHLQNAHPAHSLFVFEWIVDYCRPFAETVSPAMESCALLNGTMVIEDDCDYRKNCLTSSNLWTSSSHQGSPLHEHYVLLSMVSSGLHKQTGKQSRSEEKRWCCHCTAGCEIHRLPWRSHGLRVKFAMDTHGVGDTWVVMSVTTEAV